MNDTDAEKFMHEIAMAFPHLVGDSERIGYLMAKFQPFTIGAARRGLDEYLQNASTSLLEAPRLIAIISRCQGEDRRAESWRAEEERKATEASEFSGILVARRKARELIADMRDDEVRGLWLDTIRSAAFGTLSQKFRERLEGMAVEQIRQSPHFLAVCVELVKRPEPAPAKT